MAAWVFIFCLLPIVYCAPMEQTYITPVIEVKQDPLSKTYKILVKTPYFEKHEEILADGTIYGDCNFKINKELKSISYIISQESFFFVGDIQSQVKPENKDTEAEYKSSNIGNEEETNNHFQVHSLQEASNLPAHLTFELPYPLQAQAIGMGYQVPIIYNRGHTRPLDENINHDVYTKLNLKPNSIIIIEDLKQDTEQQSSSSITEQYTEKGVSNGKSKFETVENFVQRNNENDVKTEGNGIGTNTSLLLAQEIVDVAGQQENETESVVVNHRQDVSSTEKILVVDVSDVEAMVGLEPVQQLNVKKNTA